MTQVAFFLGSLLDWHGATEWLEHNVTPWVLIALLPLEIAAVIFIVLERRARREHIKAVKDHTRALSRQVYESLIEDGVRNAKKRIYCYWHSLHAEETSQRYAMINELLVEKRSKGLDVTLIVAKDPSRIAAAYELIQEEVPVLFQESLLISDLRFSLFDEKMTVVGLAEAEIDSDKPSRHGVDISNHKLNAMLAQHFEAELATASSLEEFVASLVPTDVLEDPTNRTEMVAAQLGVDPEIVENCSPEPDRPQGDSK